MGITIRDVAREAGVSISTVSRVLNNTCPVHEDKRQRVEAAVRALGYHPNPNARSLLKQKTHTLGVLVPFVSGDFFSAFLSSIDHMARHLGYVTLISTAHRSQKDFEAAVQVMRKRVDGLIVMATELDAAQVLALMREPIPTVFVNTRATAGTADVIQFDNYGGFRSLTEHLLALGHRRLAFIQGPPDAFDAQERRRGFEDALADWPEPTVGELVGEEITGDVGPDAYTQEAGYQATQVLIDRPTPPTAILAPNDMSAIGVLKALHEAHIRVPEDIAVTGFDDVGVTQYIVPALTTVQVPVGAMGEAAVQRLADRLANEVALEPTIQLLPVTFVARQSTAALTTTT